MWSWTSHSKNKCVLNSHLNRGCSLLTASGPRQTTANKQLQAGSCQNQALTVEHGDLRGDWGNLDKRSRSLLKPMRRWSSSSQGAAAARPGPALHSPVLHSEHTLMFRSRGELFPVEVQCPGSSLTVWMRWAQTPQGILRLGVKVFSSTARQSLCVDGPSPVCSNLSPCICRFRTADLPYIIVIMSNVHPNLWFNFCAWKQSLYLTIIPTHTTIHCYNLYGHQTLMIFRRPKKCF